MVDLRIVQQEPGQLRDGALVWRTCVREIAFVDSFSPPPGGPELIGADAYAHLLAVICGLRSPIAGETEVMHQFKAFVAALPPDQTTLRSLGQKLLADAGEIRAQHMVGMGPRSYGSAVRRRTKDCRRVAIIGTGILAAEIVRYVDDGRRAVDVWGRRPEMPFPDRAITYRRIGSRILGKQSGESIALVIAAPLTAAAAAMVAAQYPGLAMIIDLRGEAADDPITTSVPVISLQAIFEDLQHATRATRARVAAAEEEVQRRSRAFALSERPRPSGWHDLCA